VKGKEGSGKGKGGREGRKERRKGKAIHRSSQGLDKKISRIFMIVMRWCYKKVILQTQDYWYK
jgi:hypothetical protein